MKKFMMVLLLMISGVVFSQFTREYNTIGIKKTYENDFKMVDLKTIMYFEGNKIRIYSKGIQPLHLTIVSEVRIGYSNGKEYEEVTVKDNKDNYATFILFKDKNLGVIVFAGDTIFGYRNN